MRTFPDEYYKELFRLKGLNYKKDSVQRPRYFGLITNDVVYKRLAPGILEELQRQTPKSSSGRPKNKLHQRLTPDMGTQSCVSTSPLSSQS
ncbi:P63C domain-containing protein [Terrabacter aerolatus]|uniref:P63C domain-containing protein n=1 Tax=Terrabacter aerolatus TaxID=422442 RepID=UPI003CD07435